MASPIDYDDDIYSYYYSSGYNDGLQNRYLPPMMASGLAWYDMGHEDGVGDLAGQGIMDLIMTNIPNSSA